MKGPELDAQQAACAALSRPSKRHQRQVQVLQGLQATGMLLFYTDEEEAGDGAGRVTMSRTSSRGAQRLLSSMHVVSRAVRLWTVSHCLISPLSLHADGGVVRLCVLELGRSGEGAGVMLVKWVCDVEP